MSIRTELTEEIDAFLEVSGLSASALSRQTIGSPGWYSRFKAGHGCTIDSADKVREFMANWLATTGRQRVAALNRKLKDSR